MKFVIYNTMLNGDDSVLSLIDRLVDRLADEVHRIEIPEVDLLQESRWYGEARATRKKVLMSAVAKPPRVENNDQGPHLKVVEVIDADSARLADRLAHTPLVILVEDRESDGVLLSIVVEELGWPDLKMLWANGVRVTPRAVEVETAGGVGAIPQRIERAARDAREESRPLRYFVLFDSDSRWPGDDDIVRVVQPTDAIRQTCEKYNVPYHRWLKRCAESYIPDQVFEDARDDPRNSNYVDRFDALLRRSSVQRDHFPLKDGMSSAEFSQAVQAGIYDDSEERDIKLLERSLFPRSPRPLLRLIAERRRSFTADGLRQRDGQGELDNLLLAIAQEL